ncbi:MAG: hypothetical protein IJQ90_04750 [Alphaproteobacteria bacterium]|nr:hypothetical protein [Alphaproteobacteria bacterium]
MQSQNRLFVRISGTMLFFVLMVGAKNANAQEPKKPNAKNDSTYVQDMRKPWTLVRPEQAKKLNMGKKPKYPPVYMGNELDWIEIPADSIRIIPQPVVDKLRHRSK